MKSIIPELQCECGCDIYVNPLLEKVFTHLRFNYDFKVTQGVDCKKTPAGRMPNTISLEIEGARTREELLCSLRACLKKRFSNYHLVVKTNKHIDLAMGTVVGQQCAYGADDANIQSPE